MRRHLGDDIEVVFVPHTPNPASGFVHYVPRAQLVFLDWSVEEGLKVIVSGGVLQPGDFAPALASAHVKRKSFLLSQCLRTSLRKGGTVSRRLFCPLQTASVRA